MEVASILHMKGGKGSSSYASNSSMQRKAISMTKSVREEAIAKLSKSPLTCFTIADLGCSSGPNTLFVASEVIKIMHDLMSVGEGKSIEFHVFLNDLPANDFNTLFQSLPSFLERLLGQHGAGLGPCFFTGVPGSFYSRLFPTNSLHFVHSSYSLHWLSQVPREIDGNKGNIYMSKTSPPSVLRAYHNQFQRDFATFLRCRREEVISGGCMILTFIGRRSESPSCKDSCLIWDLLAMALNEMVTDGIINEEEVDAFNIPMYTPSPSEVKLEVVKEGSFEVNRLEDSSISWNGYYDEENQTSLCNEFFESGSYVAKYMRAVAEPLLVSHFGEAIIDDVFDRYKRNIAECMKKEKPEFINITLSLTRKEMA